MEEKRGVFMKIFTTEEQRELLMLKGLEKMNSVDLANEMHVSRPTVHKMIKGKTPLILQDNIYQRIQQFMADHRAVMHADK